MSVRLFRFALTIGDSRDRSSFIDTVRRAEDAGFDVLVGVDHIGPPLGVIPMLAFAARITLLTSIGTPRQHVKVRSLLERGQLELLRMRLTT